MSKIEFSLNKLKTGYCKKCKSQSTEILKSKNLCITCFTVENIANDYMDELTK